MSETSIDNKTEELIRVQNLVKYYPVTGGVFRREIAQVKAVDDVSFSIAKGETLGLVGESGCGKTTVGHTILQLLPATSGSVTFEGTDVLSLKGAELKEMRRKMQIVFQDPYASLDPRLPIGESIAEGIKIHKMGNADERVDRVIENMRRVGLENYHANRYPHEFSGGQRQRIGIARALTLQPKFIVLDEPVSALDVSIQAQVLNILRNLQKELELTYLFVAHNLAVVEHISDRVAVMYLGKIAEMAPRDELFSNPQHPYTQALMSAIPIPKPNRKRERVILSGDVPSPLNPPNGCRFHPRCPIAKDICSHEEPEIKSLVSEPKHKVACHFTEAATQ
ncbi:MAG: dipeptide ABC transporter ATP-binding protein [Anaerolineales bacterium]|uniref:Dipeptide ABC transporter ATP-binding protein n=1 Tax=Candidatus Desulfolinea nitratireducens TaxID=2841698 RepID=A0A8J6NKR4_9CHLR|nr:dipeptide ABC transporter ATP-binding protein [Candidatus Desulfolinea nitratireducens]MBL6961734.1 dipeptide ABC transporter ATP-binding protein [Anaerolineales bacterium]